MTLNEKIEEVKALGWDWETFETVNDTICLQAWPWAREMREWEFTMDGSTQIGKEEIYQAF